MEDSTDPSQLPSNCTSPVCSDPAHDDDLALNAEWSDESSDCDGDGPHRDAEDHDVQDDQDDLDGQEDEEESQGVQQDLFSLSGATAPEILTVTSYKVVPIPAPCARLITNLTRQYQQSFYIISDPTGHHLNGRKET